MRTGTSINPIRLPGTEAIDKAAGIVAAYPGIWHGVVLDVGCRRRELELALHGRPVEYVGLDRFPPADIVADVENGIPMADSEAEVVVALDVLEHIDAIHQAFAELCRVAHSHIVIALPNPYRLHWRWLFLRGQGLGGKYGLPEEPPADRHRWVFSFHEARRFCRHQAAKHRWRVVDEGVTIGPRRRRIQPLVQAWPNGLSRNLVVHLVPVGR